MLNNANNINTRSVTARSVGGSRTRETKATRNVAKNSNFTAPVHPADRHPRRTRARAKRDRGVLRRCAALVPFNIGSLNRDGRSSHVVSFIHDDEARRYRMPGTAARIDNTRRSCRAETPSSWRTTHRSTPSVSPRPPAPRRDRGYSSGGGESQPPEVRSRPRGPADDEFRQIGTSGRYRGVRSSVLDVHYETGRTRQSVFARPRVSLGSPGSAGFSTFAEYRR